HSELGRAGEERIRIRLATQPALAGVDAVYTGVEEHIGAGPREDVPAVAARRDDAQRNPRRAQRLDESDGGLEYFRALRIEVTTEQAILPFRVSTNRVGVFGIVRSAFRHLDAATPQEAADALVPRLAVDIGEIVPAGVERPERLAVPFRATAQDVVEQFLPGFRMQTG